MFPLIKIVFTSSITAPSIIICIGWFDDLVILGGLIRISLVLLTLILSALPL
jgi:hypothetical protein